jgi:hypothetical protein
VIAYTPDVPNGDRHGALRRTGLACALLSLILTLGVAATTSAQYSAAYCSIPIVNEPPWGFHAGEPIAAPSGSYSRGHGNIDLTARTVSGVVCQVQRIHNGPDRQIVLSVDPRLLYSSHYAIMWGVPGNVMRIGVRVHSSTDPNCPVGTEGKMTIFASYNGVHRDSVQFHFAAACKSHQHLYRGLDVVTNVPPE